MGCNPRGFLSPFCSTPNGRTAGFTLGRALMCDIRSRLVPTSTKVAASGADATQLRVALYPKAKRRVFGRVWPSMVEYGWSAQASPDCLEQ